MALCCHRSARGHWQGVILKGNMKLPRWGWILVAVLLAGCAEPNEQQLLADARTQLSSGDRAAALISLKNALQANNQSGEARLLLGQTLLDAGDPILAAVELTKARELKMPEARVIPLLARALLAQGLAKKVIDEFSAARLAEPVAQAEVLGVVAAAQLALGHVDKADEALKASLQAAPANADTKLVQARLLAARGETQQAVKALDEVIQAKPHDAQPISVKGELLYRQGDVAGAQEAFRRALEVDPTIASAHTALISIMLNQQDQAGARKQFEVMQKVRPAHPETQYFAAQFAYLAGDLKSARDTLARLLRYTPENPRVLQLAGMVDLQLNDLQQAETAFNKVFQQQPERASVRRLLALTNLRMGREDKGLLLLAPLLEGATPDIEALSMAANVHLSRGDSAAAEALYTRAAKANPQDPAMRIALAVTRLGRGEANAFEELQAVATSQQDPAADLAIISARLRRGELDAAQTAIEGLRRKQPTSPLPDQLAGRVAVQRGDSTTARAAFEQALKIDALYFPAVASLVALDVADGQFKSAQARLEALMQANPADKRPRLAMIELRAHAGAPRQETIKDLVAAVAELPNEAVLRVQLVEQYLANFDIKNALLTARDAAAALPSDFNTLDALGRAQLAGGEFQQAIVSFKRLALMQPRSVLPYMRLASVYRAQNNPQLTLDSLKQAQALAPADPVIVRQVVDAMLQARQPGPAAEAARTLQRLAPTLAAGHLLEGDVEAGRNNWPAALAAYRAAIAKSRPGDKAAGILHRALLQARQPAEAEAFMAARIKSHPHDADFALYRGDLMMLRGDRDAALARYAEVLALQPRNVAALNNMAWLLAMQGKADALTYAEKAVGLQPENPALLDTLALALSAAGQHARGIEVAKRALTLAPDVPSMRLTLARLYLASGQKPLARAELEGLAKLGAKFDGQAVVKRLLKSLDA